jgi:DNA-directed RNA polymerase alpha subunit
MKDTRKFTGEEAKWIGDQLGIDWGKYDAEQFRMGLETELEHGSIDPVTNITNDDLTMTAKIALAHLNEIPDYYTRLKKMEEEAGS